MCDGIVIINKPKGLTSHDVVYKIKKLLKKKIGHTGTLDPIATGVLPVCIGEATKISQFIISQDKKYLAEIKFGIRTDSFDVTGNILEEKKFIYDKQKILACINNFVGEYLQEVPIFSAVKFMGKKLYEFARAGIDIELKKRLAKIYEIKFIKFVLPDKIWIEVKCAKGVYIRALCNDIGNVYGCGACLSNLIRIEAGKFLIGESISLNRFEFLFENNLLDKKIIKIDRALDFKKVVVSDVAKNFLYNGNKIDVKFVLGNKKFFDGEKLLVYDENKKLIGIYASQENFLRPIRMFFGVN